MSRARDRFGLSDIRFYGYHGAADHERSVGQWFSVDIELRCDLDRAAADDDLTAAVDYRDAAARLVVDVGSQEPVKLLERVAQRIASALLERFPIEEARVRIRKFSPPAPGVPGRSWVEIVRIRRRDAAHDALGGTNIAGLHGAPDHDRSWRGRYA